MKFSLILATISRTEELQRFLDSLHQQIYRDFEVIVVDQNNDERLIPLLAPYHRLFSIKHIKSAPGLSHARNIGIDNVTGDIICFPDDDCWYPYNLLETLNTLFHTKPDWDGISGRTLDEYEKPTLNRWSVKSGFIPLYEPWTRATSPAIFLRREVVISVGKFDETLGVGSGTPWGSGEEIDYIVRSIKLGFRIWYKSDLFVGHPNPVKVYDQKSISRGFNYAMGFGRVQRKHNFPLMQVIYFWLRSLFGALTNLLIGNFNKSRFYWAVMNGRVKGWLN